MRARWWWPAVLAGAILLSASTANAAGGAEHAQEIEARRAFVAGEYTKAIDLFAQLYAETLHPVYLRNLGRCHQKLGHPAQAIDFFRDYLSKGRSLSVEERNEIQGYITEMEHLQKRQERDAQLASEKAQRDTEPPPPAKSEVALGLSPPPPAHKEVAIEAHSAPPPEESPPFYSRWWFWSAIGVAVAAGVTAVVLSRRTTVDEPTCPSNSTCMGP